MRLRIAVLASALSALVLVAIPAIANAAPHHNRGLTIALAPNPINAGENVLIYGQLNKAPVGGQTIVLYHHISGSHAGYTRIGSTTTNSTGFYEFTRAEGVVVTNRSWFVREGGIHGIHSRTVYERVAALVSLAANKTSSDTNHPILFTGRVAPDHAGERVFLQEQDGATSDDWTTLKSGRLGPGSNFAIPYRWLRPGERDVRVRFRTDNRNIAGVSDSIAVTIEQNQVPGFTINSPNDVIPEGSSLTVSGVLDSPGTTTFEPSTSVTLYGHQDGQTYKAILSTVTGTDGSYSFPLTVGLAPQHNEVYQVRTTMAPHRHSAQLFEGVRDMVSISESSPTSMVGGNVVFTGSVTPDKAGHAIYLQKLGSDGDWHNVEVGFVSSSSNYSFSWTFGSTGTKEFRVRIPGGPENVGAVSAKETVTVSGLAPVTSLPPAS